LRRKRRGGEEEEGRKRMWRERDDQGMRLKKGNRE
jgi:hypothetical protein